MGDKLKEIHKAAIKELYKANAVNEDEHLFTAIVLRPDVPDSHGDIYDMETVEKASINYALHCGQANLQHLVNTDLASPVHTWISPSDSVLGEGEILKGDWVMTMKIHDEEIWKMCESGSFTGFSVGCSAVTQEIEKAEATRIIKKFDFSKAHHHVALVDKAANQTEVLILKAADSMYMQPGEDPLFVRSENEITDTGGSLTEEVHIKMPMQEFLIKFYSLWNEDAYQLAGLLGFKQFTWMDREDPNYISVEVMKSISETGKASEDLIAKVAELQKKYEGKIMENKDKNKGDKDMGDKKKKEEIQKAEIQKAVDLAVAAAVGAQTTELQKAKDTIEELQKAQDAKELEGFTELVKGYSFVEQESVEEIAKAIFASKSVPGFEKIVDTLEKAQKAVDAALTKEVGSAGGEDVDIHKSTSELGTSVMEII
ncbi:hypothetical protein KAR91_53910, partial [Candidatus Pacearchaeota archaeon]|nr:hypothetical protein [Candidatus Pacearchaeota archaeon]